MRSAPGTNRVIAKFHAWLLRSLYRLLNGLIDTFVFMLWPRRRPEDVRNVCVYRIGNMGDLLCALPAMSAVRRQYSSARFVLLTSPGLPGLPGGPGVLGSVTWIDEFIEYFPADLSRLKVARRIVSNLRGRRFDVFIELPNDQARMRTLFRNALFARVIGARWARGWSVATIKVGLQRQSEEFEFPDETKRLLEVVRRCGIPTEGIEFRLPLGVRDRDVADRLLTSLGIGSDTPLIALAPGAKRPDNRWPLDRFAAVARELLKRGFHVIVVGSKDESESAKQLCEMAGPDCVSIVGRTSISESAAILERCRLAVCNDSGVQHLASSVGTPTVAIFSYWQLRGKWFPHHPQAVVLQKQVPCHTCYLKVCPLDNKCVMDISVSEVSTATLKVLGEAVTVSPGNCAPRGNHQDFRT
jgi:ADP-heptose:LPS heptosyltransferase